MESCLLRPNAADEVMRHFRAEIPSDRFRLASTLTVLVCLLGHAEPLAAQDFELTPMAGYRFGGDFFELLTRQPLDIDGAPAVGVVIDVPTSNGFQVEALFTHQHAQALVPTVPSGRPVSWHFDVDHWQAGGLQEFDTGRMRPFLTGTLGLTSYRAQENDELRFTVGAGGGIKLFPSRHVGVRLEGRAFMTVVDADVALFACSTLANQGCIVGFTANFVWQTEFTAGLIIRFN
jgi:hypothetical protein